MDNNIIKLADNEDSTAELAGEFGFYYLAHAYSATTAQLRQLNADHALWIYSVLLARGIFTYNPLEATHRAAVMFSWQTDHALYIALNEAFLDSCQGVIVVMSDGWQNSAGVTAEIEYAIQQGYPIWYLDAEEFDAQNGFGMPANVPA